MPFISSGTTKKKKKKRDQIYEFIDQKKSTNLTNILHDKINKQNVTVGKTQRPFMICFLTAERWNPQRHGASDLIARDWLYDNEMRCAGGLLP